MSDLLSTAETAKQLGIAEQTLRKWRSKGDPLIPYVKIGKLVKYSQKDIDEFIESCRSFRSDTADI